MLNYIDLEPAEIPCQFEIQFGSKTYMMAINYNQSNDFYTLDLYEIDMTPIVLAEKLTLNEQLWTDFIDNRIPVEVIVPRDLSGNARRISKSNFYKTVFLYILDSVDSEEPTEEDFNG